MNVKSLRNSNKAVGDFRESFAAETRVNLVFRFVTAVKIGGPVVRQLAKMRNFSERASLGLFLFVLFANGFDHLRRVNGNLLGVNLPQRRVMLDAFVETRLRDGGIVHFAVTMSAVANDVHDHVTA